MSATSKLRTVQLVGISIVLTIGATTVLSAILPAWGALSPDYTLISTMPTPAPQPPIPLPPNDRGYVRVAINSGSTGCSINSELVACQTSANNWPTNANGQHFHTVSVSAAGEFDWVEADLGALEGRITLDNQTYTAQGWTIVAAADGTTFTKGSSGHGMSVSDQSVKPF